MQDVVVVVVVANSRQGDCYVLRLCPVLPAAELGVDFFELAAFALSGAVQDDMEKSRSCCH